jgi:hypothetical protein
MASGPLGREQLSRRRARRVGAMGFGLALALPFALWHSVMADIASEARVDLRYVVMECSPWLLMGLGLACFAYVMVLDRRDRDRRFYGEPTRAWFAWGITLYLLGFALATQVAQMAHGFSAY